MLRIVLYETRCSFRVVANELNTRKVKQYLENLKRVSLHDRVLAYFGSYLLRPLINLLAPQGSPTLISFYRNYCRSCRFLCSISSRYL